MKKITIYKILAFFILIAGVICYPSYAFTEDEPKATILIDPGHGGADGGARSKNGTLEKDINLSISKKLKDELESRGYKVYMTREDDISLSPKKRQDLEARCNMKKETNCDAFISIHQNKFSNERCFGAQVWYSDYKDSEKFALDIQNSLKENLDNGNKRVPKSAQKQFKILRDGYNAPCVIVECGFISNYQEEKNLKSSAYQDKIVKAIADGVNSYFQN